MHRYSFICIVLAMVFCSALYCVTQNSRDAKEEMKYIASEIEQEKESIRVLKAEWSYLNRPQRLESLAAKYLALHKASPSQFIEIEDVKVAANVVTERPIVLDERISVVASPDFSKKNFKQRIVESLQDNEAALSQNGASVENEKVDEDKVVAKNGDSSFKAMIREWGNE